MSPVEWYYARGNKQNGPVPSGELKRLAAAGELRPEDLVWREGMAEWAPARNVRGLFDDEGRAAAVAELLSSGPASSPLPFEPQAAMPSSVTAGTHATRVARLPRRHLFDTLLDWLRKRFGPAAIEKTANNFRAVGSLGLYLAMLLVVVYTVVSAVNDRGLDAVPSGVVLLLVLAVLQWAAGKFCDALDRLNRTTSSTLSSTAFPDFCAIASLGAGTAGLIVSVVSAAAIAMHAPTGFGLLVAAAAFLLGLLGFVVCGFLAVVAVNLAALNIAIDPEVRAGEEAIGVSAFLLKALLRLVPVWFGSGVVCGTVLLGCACCLVFATPAGPGGALLDDMAAGATGAVVRSVLVGFAALPVAAYLMFVFYCLVIEVLRAFLILPGKIDKLAEKSHSTDQ